uniref:Uncharacterized protein n=1 Tax=Panagrolaimus sp. JU765 TaxID=591449 RepID=A0AC34QCF0_9BILA
MDNKPKRGFRFSINGDAGKTALASAYLQAILHDNNNAALPKKSFSCSLGKKWTEKSPSDAIIFTFDTSNRKVFEDIEIYWIKKRELIKKTPVFLIGTYTYKTKLMPAEVSKKEVSEFVSKYKLDGYFFINLNSRAKIIETLNKIISITNNINGYANHPAMFVQPPQEKCTII